MNKTIWRIIKKWILLAGIVAVMLSAILAFITRFTPKPVAWLLRRVFDKPPKKPLEAIQLKAIQPKEAQEKAVAPQDDQEKAINIKDIQAKSIQEIENIHYGQEAKEVLDLYVPVEEGKYPVILWIHGGAFVGGDKKDVLYFARELTKQGYAVAAINYALAPESQYPRPILQTNKAYEFLVKGDYLEKEKIDTRQIFLAGDSAGAFIAAQCVLLQSNEVYRQAFIKRENLLEMPKVNYQGVLLYCGPYLLAETKDIRSPLVSFLTRQVQWAYWGEKNFALSEHSAEIDVIKYAKRGWPPTFITDGNTFSFASHGKALAKQLKKEGVEVDELFFDNEEKVVHEYQFDLSSKAGEKALRKTLRFLGEYS